MAQHFGSLIHDDEAQKLGLDWVDHGKVPNSQLKKRVRGELVTGFRVGSPSWGLDRMSIWKSGGRLPASTFLIAAERSMLHL